MTEFHWEFPLFHQSPHKTRGSYSGSGPCGVSLSHQLTLLPDNPYLQAAICQPRSFSNLPRMDSLKMASVVHRDTLKGGAGYREAAGGESRFMRTALDLSLGHSRPPFTRQGRATKPQRPSAEMDLGR